MTISSSINASRLSSEYGYFETCAEESPDFSYDQAKQIKEMIGHACDKLIRDTRALGLSANNCDGIREVEAVIYRWLKNSNPEETIFPVAEGFGSAMQGPARARVLDNCRANVDFMKSIGVIV